MIVFWEVIEGEVYGIKFWYVFFIYCDDGLFIYKGLVKIDDGLFGLEIKFVIELIGSVSGWSFVWVFILVWEELGGRSFLDLVVVIVFVR